MRHDLPDDASEIRARLVDVARVCRGLGLCDGYSPGRQSGGGLLIRCPAHKDKTPSCSVRIVNGTIGVKCQACGFGGNVLHLIAAAHDLDVKRDFRQVLAIGAELAGYQLARPGERPLAPLPPRPAPVVVEVPRTYPPVGEVEAVWALARPVVADAEASAYLEGRALNLSLVDLYDLARVIPHGVDLPAWAAIGEKPRPWSRAGYRLIVPVYDATGAMRSLRAWTFAAARAKRIAPTGHTTAGLVMADMVAREVLRTGAVPAYLDAPMIVVVTEGEPDFLSWAGSVSDANETPPAVFGVVNSAWSAEVAARIPDGSRVALRTHLDQSGHKYANEAIRTLGRRCELHRIETPSEDEA